MTTPPPTPEQEQDAADEPLGPLDKRPEENAEQHRGLLLFAMQDPRKAKRGKRSKRAVSRALARDESTVRYWSDRKACKWAPRIRAAGSVAAQTIAMRLYRELYLSKAGRIELDVIRPLVSVTVYPDAGDPPPPDSVSNLPSPTAPEGTSAAKRKRGPQQEADERDLKRQVLVYDAVIARAAKDIQSGKLKVSAKDLPFIFGARKRAQNRLDEMNGAVQTGPQNVRIPESYRVRLARSSGGDVMGALAEDAHDLAIALQAIRNQRDADLLTAARLTAARAEDGASELHDDDTITEAS